MVTGFRSKNAVKMWQKVRQLWSVTNPQSTNYNFMQEPLLSGEVWVAWDHVARLINAVQQQPTQFRLVPSPRGPAGLGYMVVIGGLAIPKGAPDAKSAQRLIDYLTQPTQQINTLTNLAFFPATNVKVPVTINTGTWLESLAVKDQARAKKTIPALVPVGLGSQGGAFNKVYIDTFRRIAINGENIQSVLKDEAPQLQTTLNASTARCWAPDPPSKGTCHVK
jgi:multiple sugar transport system substrate-binding protein